VVVLLAKQGPGHLTNKTKTKIKKNTPPDADPEEIDPAILPPTVLAAVEADSFWCLSRLLDGIQDNYITAQPGIQRSVKRMAELVARIDAPLSEHLATQGVEFMQFAFRWMNCLLMREISVKNTVRMWDTYLVRLFFSLFFLALDPEHRHIDNAWLCNHRRKVRTHFLSFTCMSVQRFSSGGARSSVRWTSRYAGVLIGPSYPFLTLTPPLFNPPGHYHVPAVVADTGLDGRRNRNAPQPSVRAQFDLAQRAEPLYGKVKDEGVLPYSA
jgi:Rab-GTPase-TBC domain